MSRNVLRLTAGVIWSGVGIGLCIAAAYWLLGAHGGWIVPLGLGIVVGAPAYYFGFRHLVRKNVTRIYEQAPGKEKVCVFAFQNARSYVIMVVMIVMGYSVRHTSIPRLYLVPIYLAMGLALLLGSFHYYPAPEFVPNETAAGSKAT